ncbi:hypothetical protein EU527_00670 [Candidatus Thorarchaeota archaeon]|nr:MAG: hypothetical protein EU527_00670 [Candidatus Thorarchaeota archaeon]
MHIFQLGDRNIEKHLAFRDYMIAHPDETQVYAKRRRNLAKKCCQAVHTHIAGKEG